MERYIINKKFNGKIQRVFACALAFLCLAALLMAFSSHAAYADGGSKNISDSAKAVDVDLTWGAMSFTYTNEYTTWNPTTHKYDRTVEAAWKTKDNLITLDNKGADIKANFSSELKVSTVEGLFKENNTAEGMTTYSMELGEKETGTVYFELSGAIDTTYDYIGKILVTIIAK